MSGSIWVQLLVASGLVLATTVFHLMGLAGLGALISLFERDQMRPLRWWRIFWLATAVVVILIALHVAEIWFYAFIYWVGGAFGAFSKALLYSTSAYCRAGVTDPWPAPEWRLIGAIEGVNGLLLLAWTIIFASVEGVRLRTEWRRHVALDAND